MIRDEFNKQSEKKVTAREMEKIRTLGERGYYSSMVMKITNIIKAADFSSWFAIIAGAIAALLMVFNYVVDAISLKNFIITMSIVAVLFLWGGVWFIFVRRSLKKKVARYKNIINDLNEAVAKKNAAAYNRMQNNK